jgi:BlaI family penicillinase repressor
LFSTINPAGTMHDPYAGLSRRERQVMDVIHRKGRAAVADIEAELPDASYDSVRAALRVLRQKELIRHEHDGKRYVYVHAAPRDQAEKRALRHVVDTFFQGSSARTLAALVEITDADVPDDELERLERLIQAARCKGGAQ